ncbi:DUF7287 family protein [Halorientalis litorea]|jgi:hypothetical protein|uniref:DUF7287 family protein n=1 Tax=Halorientalis litorea TaxID=2931977 RepID=UPI001FF39107|nr:hypothetical protein [Halorientalis litorea]
MSDRRVVGSSARTGRRTRAQTTLDFAVGVSIFLLALTSVLLFIPGTISPFVEGGQEEIVTANRVADSLSEGLLGDPKTPHVVNTTCTVKFFEDTSPGYCGFTGNNLTERIGVRNTQLANVSIESNLTNDADGGNVLCWDEDSSPPEFVEKDSGDCDSSETRTAIGPAPPQRSGTTVTARRVVELNDTDATLVVEMW